MRFKVMAFGALILFSAVASGETVDTTSWITLNADTAFSLRAPPGTVYREMDGIDSYVAGFDNPQFHVIFDYGPYSGALSGYTADKGYRFEDIEIDGRKAQLITGPGRDLSGCNDLVTAAYVFLGHREGMGNNIRLLISGCTKSTAALETLHAMFRSIRFAPR
jgi:hypothetical protein